MSDNDLIAAIEILGSARDMSGEEAVVRQIDEAIGKIEGSVRGKDKIAATRERYRKILANNVPEDRILRNRADR